MPDDDANAADAKTGPAPGCAVHLVVAADAPLAVAHPATPFLPATLRLDAQQGCWLFVMQAFGGALVNAAVNFGIHVAVYASNSYPIDMFLLPNALAGDFGVTLIVGGFVTWILGGVLCWTNVWGREVAPLALAHTARPSWLHRVLTQHVVMVHHDALTCGPRCLAPPPCRREPVLFVGEVDLPAAPPAEPATRGGGCCCGGAGCFADGSRLFRLAAWWFAIPDPCHAPFCRTVPALAAAHGKLGRALQYEGVVVPLGEVVSKVAGAAAEGAPAAAPETPVKRRGGGAEMEMIARTLPQVRAQLPPGGGGGGSNPASPAPPLSGAAALIPADGGVLTGRRRATAVLRAVLGMGARGAVFSLLLLVPFWVIAMAICVGTWGYDDYGRFPQAPAIMAVYCAAQGALSGLALGSTVLLRAGRYAVQPHLHQQPQQQRDGAGGAPPLQLDGSAGASSPDAHTTVTFISGSSARGESPAAASKVVPTLAARRLSQ